MPPLPYWLHQDGHPTSPGALTLHPTFVGTSGLALQPWGH